MPRGTAVRPPLIDDLLARCTFPARGAAIDCAVSGGADSLALMVLAVEAGCVVTAIHVDHGLRDGSEREAELVAAAARRFGASFRSETASVAPGQGGLEARARRARLAVLPPDAATGHTMDDQAETVVLNLLRGAGPDGMAAMTPGPHHPLLAIRRDETRALCRSVALEWFEDPSNAERRHLRNRVRHELLPMCSSLAGRDLVPVLARQAEVFRAEAALLSAMARDAVPDPSDARSLAAAPLPLARRAVRRWFEDELGPDAGAEYHPPSLADVTRILSVAAGSARATEVSGGYRVRRSHGVLAVEPPTSGSVPPVARNEGEAVPDWAGPHVGGVLLSEHDVAERVRELGQKITADYADHPPLLVGVLKGAMLFMSDLCRTIELPVDVDFMAVSSYGSATRTSGVVRIVKDLDAELTDRHVLVVEDIIDSGLTLNYLRRYLQARGPASLEVCALLVKEGQQRADLDLRYVGFTIPSDFVVGYGLDVDERYRNLRGVHVYRNGTR